MFRILSVSIQFLALPFPVIGQGFKSPLTVGIVNNENIQVKSHSYTTYSNFPEFDLKERNKSFEEAFDQMLNEYLPDKEKEFIQNLREVYKVKEIYPNLKQAYNSYNFRHAD
ncbi:hypothetical protein ACKGJO_04420 [Gracilimonas sp. Q87]|uniref:hypothetical protein n=1 Tax=Gracilimonas sp. Q87 TaxID=3384766 RepID=UPI0039842779